MRPLIACALLACCLLSRPAAAQHSSVTWVNLGYAFPGTYGDPLLVVNGTLQPASALSLSLSNTIASHYCFMVMGTSIANLPYKGGTLVPYPDVVLLFATSDAGTLSLAGHFPPGVPPGVPIIFQFWINDPAALAGRSGSNAVGALTP